ncbi:hypothetical protein F4804DRAFT_338509 [Jackrogersella minutella]|nr:hypothetical protein F4804DRAFT_338509 [Jackrogersella minutella]
MASEPSCLAPGLSIETRFDFKGAFDFVRAQINGKIPETEWYQSIGEAFRTCLYDTQGDQQISALWFALNLLDILWYILFGKITGPSLWKKHLGTISQRTLNGRGDQYIDLNILKVSIDYGDDTIEETVRQMLQQHFPMTVCLGH